MSATAPERRGKAFRLEAGTTAALSAAKALWWSAGGAALRAIAKPKWDHERHGPPKAPPTDLKRLRRAWLEAFAKDAADVAAGLYPPSERLADPQRAVAAVMDLLADAREVDARRRRKGGVEAREAPGAEAYPTYYRQNFHYQSGGWFTKDSARRYEAQVEALFSGTAGAMRRRALSLLAKAWKDQDQRGRRLVDLACGSGAFLADLKAAFPRADVIGLDLSLPYLAEAQRRSGAKTVQANAEATPFADASLDAVTSVYLFHELPPRVRPKVAAEIARILKPGGVFVLADSVQAQDEQDLARLLEVFPVFFHEPYYNSYQETDLAALFGAAGLQLKSMDQAFLTKALLFEKA
jgi:ubiquinone/menaquinone biosynthesis C-methylase UbiE